MFIPKRNAEDPTVSGSGAGGSVTASKTIDDGLKNEIQKIVMGIFKEAVPRVVQQSIQASIPTMLDKIAEEALKEAPSSAQAAGNAADGEKPTMKAMQARIDDLQKALQAQQQAAKEASVRERDVRNRNEVERQLTAKLGAGNPLIGTLMDSLYDVKKRFVEQDGRLTVKFNDAGYDDFKPLDEGIKMLFDGELKPLVQQSRVPQMPPNGINPRQFGQVVPQQQQSGQQPVRANPLLMGIAEVLHEGGRTEAAQTLANDAVKLAAMPQPVRSQK